MNILFVSALLPYPLHSGGQVRIYNLIKQLSKRHEITLVSFIRDENERTLAKNLSFCKDVHMILRGRAWQPKYLLGALGKYPFLLSTYHNGAMRSKLEELLKNIPFDLVHLEPFYVWPSLPQTKLPIVVSEHNIEYEVYEQYAKKFPFLFTIDNAKLRRWEQMVWKKASRITAVSQHDKAIIQPFASKNVTVVLNGVDISQFSFQKHTVNNYRVLFVGNFRWVANHDAAYTLVRDIFPNLRKRFPQASIRIVGIDIPVGLKTEVFKIGGEIQEHVSDISHEYREADVLIAPHAVSGGSKYKVLEAFASGLPVVTTRQGASGLGAVPDTHYKEASTPEGFVEKTAFIWEHKEEAFQLPHNARNLVEERYTWDNISNILEGVWNEAKH